MPQDIAALKTTLAKEIEERRQTFVGRKTVDVGDLPGFLDLIERARQLHAVEPYAEAINLEGLQFVRQVVLESAESTLPPISFRSCTFSTGVKFTGLTIAGLCMDGSHLYMDAVFERCIFSGELTWSGANFHGLSNFTECVFKANVRFLGTQFRNEGHFVRCDFQKFAYFDDTRFHILADFSFSRFFNARFNNATFSDTTSFTGAIFAPWAPRFHGTSLHHDTSFAGASFQAYEHEQDWRAYRTLKQKMAEVKAQEEESFFFAAEQRARRKFRLHLTPLPSDYIGLRAIQQILVRSRKSLSTLHQDTVVAPSVVNSAMSLLYDYASSYGQNIARPFLWWTLQLTVFAYIYWATPHLVSTAAPWLSAGETVRPILTAVMLSIQNSLNPLSLFARDPLITVRSFSMFLLSMAQAITSLSLITLGLLAIRRRFHKGSE